MYRDSGIGMTHQELVDSLGTIAHSGTAKFLKALKVDTLVNMNKYCTLHVLLSKHLILIQTIEHGRIAKILVPTAI